MSDKEVYDLKYEDLYGPENEVKPKSKILADKIKEKEITEVKISEDGEEIINSLEEAKEIVKQVFGKEDNMLIEKIGISLYLQKNEQKKTDRIIQVLSHISDAVYSLRR